MDLKTRPQYYDGQYLGADDLEAIVEYVRVAQAQHALGAHAWGIGIGLDLVERNLVGDDVEVVLTPGLAWDGYAHAIVAPAPQRIGLDRFADFQDDTPAAGVQLEIWLIYRELPAQPPGVGFSCPDDDLHARIVDDAGPALDLGAHPCRDRSRRKRPGLDAELQVSLDQRGFGERESEFVA